MANMEISSSTSSSESESDEEAKPQVSIKSGLHVSDKPTCGFLRLSVQDEPKSPPSKQSDFKKSLKLSSSLQPGKTFSDTYISIFPDLQPGVAKDKLKQLSLTSRLCELESKNVVAQPGFEKQYVLPPYLKGRKKRRQEGLKERDKTKGASWFNMPATEVTEEIKNDLAILQMRGSIDPKHFYKRGSERICPKYFRVGTVVESPADFYHARIPKKQRKRTLVEELLADAEFRKYQKKKYAEAMKNQHQKRFHSSHKKKSKEKKSNIESQKKRKTKKTR